MAAFTFQRICGILHDILEHRYKRKEGIMKLDGKTISAGAALRKLLYVILGNLCYALAINLFMEENGISAGGFAGLAIALRNFVPVSTGVFVLVLSLPLFVWAVFIKGWSFTLVGLAGSLLYTLEVDGSALILPCVTRDPLLAALCGGALNGAAAMLFLMADSNSGGTDLLARLLLTRHKSLSMGRMFLICDGAVVLVAMLAQRNLEIGIYSLIGIAVSSYVNDLFINGLNKANIYFIIPSGPAAPLADAILQQLERGVTMLPGKGMYAGTERQVLMTVVKPAQGYRVKALVKEMDPEAFVFMANAAEVSGFGFVDVDASSQQPELDAQLRSEREKRK